MKLILLFFIFIGFAHASGTYTPPPANWDEVFDCKELDTCEEDNLDEDEQGDDKASEANNKDGKKKVVK